MLLRHATLTRNLPSIAKHGLLCSKSLGKLKAVWLHKADAKNSLWAFAHTIRRHSAKAQSVVFLTFAVPRGMLRKGNRPGLFYCVSDIGPECLRAVLTFAEISE